MPIVTLDQVEKHYSGRAVLDGVSLTLDRGDRVGLIGVNGAGKSTLLRLIAGQETPDAGVVSVARGCRIGRMDQDPVFAPGQTLLDEAEAAFERLHALAAELRRLEHDLASPDAEVLARALRQYERKQHEFESAGGHAWRHRLEATLQGVGLGADLWGTPVEALSGGQRSRLALAKILVHECDILLLDEPTNHLDVDAVEWLEGHLAQFRGAVLLISHDRMLLDRLATRIAWIEAGRLRGYPGNYSTFAALRAEQELTQQRAFEKQQAFIEKQQEFIRRFGAGQRAREAQGREKRLNRLLRSDDLIAGVTQARGPRLQLATAQRTGDLVLRVDGLSKSFAALTLWREASFELRRGDRVGVVGGNGSGKTTLLRCLLGEMDADDGVVRWGTGVNIGYYDQSLDDFDPADAMLEHVYRATGRNLQVIRDLLGALRLGDAMDRPMGVLSGGQRARVALAQLLLGEPNVLVLDEPTNHLDVDSREALESALRGFAGTILCVSHDRYFLQRATTALLWVTPPDVRLLTGGLDQWRALREQAARRALPPSEPAPRAAPQPRERRDNPYKRPFGRLTLEQLEQEIAQSEADLRQCDADYADPAVFRDAGAARALRERHDALRERLEQLEQEYFGRQA